MASVIANHYDETWVSYSSYTVAGLVGVARIYHDAHFASDVLAGALIGTLVGKSVVARNKTMRSRQSGRNAGNRAGIDRCAPHGKFLEHYDQKEYNSRLRILNQHPRLQWMLVKEFNLGKCI